MRSRFEKVSGITRTVLVSCLILALAAPACQAQWGRVGGQPQEDSRSVAFIDAGSGTYIALAGEKRFGVFYSTVTGNGTISTPWTPTWLDEFNLSYTVNGTTTAVAMVNCVTAAGQTALAGTSNGKVYYSSTPTSATMPWNACTFTPEITNGSVMELVTAPNGEVLACVSGGNNPGIYVCDNILSSPSFTCLAGSVGSGLFMSVALHGDYGSTHKFWAVTDDAVQTGGVYFFNGSTWGSETGPGIILPTGYSSIAVSPGTGDPASIWVGNLDGKGFWESTDLGLTWTEKGTVCDPVTSIAVPSDYATSHSVLVGTGFGFKLYNSLSGTIGDIYPTNMAINSISEYPTANGFFWLGTSSGVKKVIPGASFPEDVERDAMAMFDVSHIAASPNYLLDNVLFALSERVGLFISRDSGVSFSMYMPPLGQSQAPDPGFKISGFGVDPAFNGVNGTCGNTSSTVYLATMGKGVFKSSSAGSDWTPINTGVISGNLNICKFAVTPHFFAYPLFAATCNSSAIARFNGSTSQWEATTLPIPAPAEITAIAFPPNFPTPPTVFVGGNTGLYVSDNGGSSFIFLGTSSFPLPPSGQTAVTSISFHPGFDNNTQTVVFVVRGGCLYQGTSTAGAWSFVQIGQSSFPTGQYFIDRVTVSPFFPLDQTMAATFINPMSRVDNGVYLSTNGGSSWTIINGISPNELKDRYPKTIRLITSPLGVRLLAGTRKDRLFFSDSSNYSAWTQAGGWETSPSCVNALAASSEPTPTTCGAGSSATPTDVFLGTCKGVFWSNDGGATFRPINEGLTETTTIAGCAPFPVNALHIESASTGSGIQPVLIAGTESHGIWYRNARALMLDTTNFLGWDWSSDPATGEPKWYPSNLPSGTVYDFSRESMTPQIVRAATDNGVYSTSGLAGTIGQTWVQIGLVGEDVRSVCHGVSGTGLKESMPDPKAPEGGTVWGTVWGTGVKRGTGTALTSALPQPEAITWEVRNGTGAGTIADTNQQSVIQLTDGTVLAGAGASVGSGTGIYRSPDEGRTIWYTSNGGIDATSKDITEFLECSSNQDVFCAVEGTSSNGGIFLSANKGVDWVSISQGFDPQQQALADIIQTEGTPPVYYAGSYGRGTYATTITPLSAPTLSSIDVSTGSSAGGTTVTITGTNFLCSCPANYSCVTGRTQATASFGGIDGSTISCSSTQLVVTTPKHPTGKATVTVRNPDTRVSSSSQQFTFSDGSNVEITLSRDVSNNIVVTWTGAGYPTKMYRSNRRDFTGWVESATISSSPYTYSDASGTDTLCYYYTVE